MRKAENINNLINFTIMNDYVKSNDKKFYFYRFLPPNISILTQNETELEISALANLIESVNMPFQIFAMDKVENLNRNKEFFQSMNEKYKKYTEQIINQISSHDADDNKTNSIQRAYYFIISTKNASEKNEFEDALNSQRLKSSIVKHDELATVFRNYYLREFSPFDILAFSKEMREKYDAVKNKRTAKA